MNSHNITSVKKQVQFQNWASQVKQLQESGMSISAWCKLNGIKKGTYYHHLVHFFLEGNTRTTAVFIERYLNTIGFKVNNEMFEKNSVYFRNALVRSNFADFSRGISSDNKFINMFFHNLLNDKNHILDADELICRECFGVMK